MHENACKGLHEGTGRFFKNVDLERQSPLDIFLRDKTIFNFFFFFFLTEWRGATFATPVHVHRKCHVSMHFLGKVVPSFPAQGKNIIFSEKK